MFEYVIKGRRYELRYSDLHEDYKRFAEMPDESFLENLVPVLHFVCVVSYFKGTPGYILTSDVGLIHQLVHLMEPATREGALTELREIREQFNVWCKLS